MVSHDIINVYSRKNVEFSSLAVIVRIRIHTQNLVHSNCVVLNKLSAHAHNTASCQTVTIVEGMRDVQFRGNEGKGF